MRPLNITATRVGQRAHHGQVMADEQDRQAHLLLQVQQQVDDLRLDRHIERRGRLIRHQHRRPQDQGAGDGDALALAAGQFVRIALAVAAVQARRGPASPAPVRSVRRACQARGCAGVRRRSAPASSSGRARNSCPERPPACWRRKGFSAAWPRCGDVGAVDQDLARGRLDQPHRHHAGGGLARSGFAHQPQDACCAAASG